MLVSHRKKFIFTKTAKTAGTSVESYFEKYCMPEGEWQQSHTREEYISETGIIGYRGKKPPETKFYGHMSASEIKGYLGPEVWEDYFKFTVIRNPFDKLVSGFKMYEDRRKAYSFKRKIKTYIKRRLNRGDLHLSLIHI